MTELAWVPVVLLLMCVLAHILETMPSRSVLEEDNPTYNGLERRR